MIQDSPPLSSDSTQSQTNPEEGRNLRVRGVISVRSTNHTHTGCVYDSASCALLLIGKALRGRGVLLLSRDILSQGAAVTRGTNGLYLGSSTQ